MKDLVIFCFETGDSSVPYWQERVLVDHNKMDYNSLEDAISSYIDAVSYDDKEYEDIATDIMNASGWQWKWFNTGSTIQEVYIYWI